MDTFESIEDQLPWGFHDALLVRLEIDWLQALAKMDLRVATTEKQEEDRLGQLTFGGLVFFAIDPPELDEARGYLARHDDGLKVSCGEGVGHEGRRDAIPAIPTRRSYVGSLFKNGIVSSTSVPNAFSSFGWKKRQDRGGHIVKRFFLVRPFEIGVRRIAIWQRRSALLENEIGLPVVAALTWQSF